MARTAEGPLSRAAVAHGDSAMWQASTIFCRLQLCRTIVAHNVAYRGMPTTHGKRPCRAHVAVALSDMLQPFARSRAVCSAVFGVQTNAALLCAAMLAVLVPAQRCWSR